MVMLVVGSAGGTARVAPLKGLVRVCEKAVLEYQRLLQCLVDILRAQIMCVAFNLFQLNWIDRTILMYLLNAFFIQRLCSCEDVFEVEAVVRAVVALDSNLAALLVGIKKVG